MRYRRALPRMTFLLAISYLAAPTVFATGFAPAPTTCVVDTRANYMTLGTTGCDFNGFTFSNFNFSVVSFVATVPITASQVIMTPHFTPDGMPIIDYFSPAG